MNCQSCGMPMDKPEDHGGGDVNNPFCLYCTDEQGNLMPREQVRAKMIQFYIQKQGKTQEEAERATDQLMGAMPAWKGEGEGVVASVEPTAPPAAEPKPETVPSESAEGAAVPKSPAAESTEGAAVPGVAPEPTESVTEQPAEPTTEEPMEAPKPESKTPTE